MANNSSDSEYRSLKIEDVLPVKTVGVESLKEANPESMSPHRRIFRWFARRPTAATRLAVLASILPQDVTNDELLSYMCVGPKQGVNGRLEDYVVQKYATKGQRDGSVEDHFGYEYPHKNIPSDSNLEELHSRLREHWDGELPTVIDPTAGGGTIPLESFRYGLPTISNELNPIAWLINKTILEYAASHERLVPDVRDWMGEISDIVEQELAEYFPERNGVKPNHYFRAYSIECPSCGEPFPLSNRWWFNRKKGKAIRPIIQNSSIRFDVVSVPDDVSKEVFDPADGTVGDGDAECPSCGVVTERDQLVEIFQDGDFEFEVCGVRFEEEINGSQYHSPTQEDLDAIKRAEEKIETDLDLSTLLSNKRYVGLYDRSAPYGITRWRDLFSPRQLLSHATYLHAFEKIKPKIRAQNDLERAEAILVLLSFVSVKLIERNSRLQPFDIRRGSPANMLGNNGFFFVWHFSESNLMTGSYSYHSAADNVLSSFNKVRNYVSKSNPEDVAVRRGDAADLPYEASSIEAVVIDPPYGDNLMYSETSDAFYVWFREYLGDVFPDSFSSPETNKEDEAVENPVIVSPTQDESTSSAARRRYEEKMSDIFSETYRVLERGGVLTVYFTDKETAAWDSLTMSLINSGFTVTSTHTITSEMPQRIGMQERSSADSTLLLTCRKPLEEDELESQAPTLWSDIRSRTRVAAREKATKLMDSDINLTKTDTIIGAFGPTLRVFTENYPVVDKHDNPVRPKQALEEARAAVVEVLVERELEDSLDEVDGVTTWYILGWLVYEREVIPYDDARQLGLGVGINIDEVKRDTKIWGKSGDQLILKGQDYRVQDYTALESGEKRRKRAYPVDPRDESFNYVINAIHAALNVLETKGGDFAWNWLNDRDLQNQRAFKRAIRSLLQVLPEDADDHDLLINIVSGETGELLEIESSVFANTNGENEENRTTLQDF